MWKRIAAAGFLQPKYWWLRLFQSILSCIRTGNFALSIFHVHFVVLGLFVPNQEIPWAFCARISLPCIQQFASEHRIVQIGLGHRILHFGFYVGSTTGLLVVWKAIYPTVPQLPLTQLKFERNNLLLGYGLCAVNDCWLDMTWCISTTYHVTVLQTLKNCALTTTLLLSFCLLIQFSPPWDHPWQS